MKETLPSPAAIEDPVVLRVLVSSCLKKSAPAYHPEMPRRHPTFSLPRLRESLKPFRLHFYPRLHSTNDHAAKLRKKNQLFAPAIILTAHQIAGRGRGSNTWWSD